jgi:iron complex outermembrane recepter protein
MKLKSFGRRGLLLTVCATTIYAAPVLAQNAPAPAAERQVEEVVVTATRRETALQAVAVAVTAVGAQALQDAGVKDIRDLQQLAPSLQVPVSENSGSVTARLRGIGTQGSNPGLESSVGIVIDGVVRARNSLAFSDLGEIRAIEVLRGPQGTLFGVNTSAGLINVNTKKPSFEWGASGDITVGNYGLGGVGLGITGPLIEDKLAGRLYVTGRARQGYLNIENGVSGQAESNDQAYVAVRGQLLFTPNENFDARLILDTSSRSESCCAGQVFITDVRPVSSSAILNKIVPNAIRLGKQLENNVASANRSYLQDIDESGISLEMNFDIGPGKLTSITAQREWKRRGSADSDYTGADLLYSLKEQGAGSDFSNFTQELRYSGNVGKLDYLFGGFYSSETIDVHSRFRIGDDYQTYIGSLLAGANALNPALNNAALAGIVNTVGLPPGTTRAGFTSGGGQNDDYQQKSRSISAFTHNIYEVNDALSFTLGLRYTSQEKDFRADYLTTGNGACRAYEAQFGLNPTTGAVLAGAAALAPVVGALCAPWMRSALDNLDHRQSKEEKEWSGIVSASYKFADNINSYASFSRGYKAGGFNLDRAFSSLVGGVNTSVVSGAVGTQTVAQPDTSFSPETVDAYEIGLKTQWFNRALTANLALFHQTFENFQLNTFTGISFVVTEVPEVVSQGAELDFFLRTPIEGLTISGGAAYTLAEYADDLGSAAVPNTFLGRNPNLYYLPGNQLTSAPKWTFGSAINYERSVFNDNAVFKSYVDFRHSSEYLTGSNLDPRKLQSGITLVNGRLGLSTKDERWTAELWGRNLTDKRYAQITFDAPLQGDGPQLNAVPGQPGVFAPRAITSQINAFAGEPRTYGATLRWTY